VLAAPAAALVRRAKSAQACAEDAPDEDVAQRLGNSDATAGKWRRPFIEQWTGGGIMNCGRARFGRI